MTRIRRDRSSPHYNQFQRYTTKEHRNSILKLRCKSKRGGPTIVGRMSASEPFDGTSGRQKHPRGFRALALCADRKAWPAAAL